MGRGVGGEGREDVGFPQSSSSALRSLHHAWAQIHTLPPIVLARLREGMLWGERSGPPRGLGFLLGRWPLQEARGESTKEAQTQPQEPEGEQTPLSRASPGQGGGGARTYCDPRAWDILAEYMCTGCASVCTDKCARVHGPEWAGLCCPLCTWGWSLDIAGSQPVQRDYMGPLISRDDAHRPQRSLSEANRTGVLQSHVNFCNNDDTKIATIYCQLPHDRHYSNYLNTGDLTQAPSLKVRFSSIFPAHHLQMGKLRPKVGSE